MDSRVCWACSTFAHMERVHKPIPLSLNPDATTAAYSCAKCSQLSIMVSYKQPGRATETLWVPWSPIGKEYPHVPKHIASAASESHRCHSIDAYRASVLLARSVVEATAKDKEITKGRLADKIDSMEAQGLIRPIVKDAAHEIRYLGNEMAHGDFVESVTEEESSETLELMDLVLNEVYQETAKIEAMRQARLAKTSAPAEIATTL